MQKFSLYILLFCLSLAGGKFTAHAQTSSTLSVVRQNYDVFSEGMGVGAGASYGRTHYIYASPTSVFRNDVRGITTSWTTKYLPRERVDLDRTVHNALSVGWRFKNHAILAGARYSLSPSIVTTNAYGDSRTLHPFDFTADLGYALQISPNWSAYAIGHFVMSQINKIAYTGGGSVGVSYATDPIKGVVPMCFSLGVRNMGGLVQYGQKGSRYTMPGSVTLSGDALYQIAPLWMIQGMVSADYVVQPISAKLYTIGMGVNIVYHQGLSMRLGGTLTNGMSYASVGLGYHLLSRIDLDLSYRFCMQDRAFNAFGVGLSVDLWKKRDTQRPFVY